MSQGELVLGDHHEIVLTPVEKLHRDLIILQAKMYRVMSSRDEDEALEFGIKEIGKLYDAFKGHGNGDETVPGTGRDVGRSRPKQL